MGWRETIFLAGGLLAGLLLSLGAINAGRQRGPVYEIPILKEVGDGSAGSPRVKTPAGMYRVTTYNGKAWLMIELPKGEKN